MAKQQINFRIDPALLEQIKDQAEREGISYTQWIINACLSQLNPDPLVTLDDEMQASIATTIQYRNSNIQYSDPNIQSAIQEGDPTHTENTNDIWEQIEPKVKELIDEAITPLQKHLEQKASIQDLEGLYCLIRQQQTENNEIMNDLL